MRTCNVVILVLSFEFFFEHLYSQVVNKIHFLSFQCKDSHVNAIDYRMDDYLEHPGHAPAFTENHLELSYQNGILKRVVKTGNRFSESCTANLLPDGEVVQMLSSARSAPSCASNNIYQEMRGSDQLSRIADIKSGFHTEADNAKVRNQNRLNAYYAQVTDVAGAYDEEIAAFNDQLTSDEQTIQSYSDPGMQEHDRFTALCGRLNAAECKVAIEEKAANEREAVKEKKYAALRAIPKPQVEIAKPGAETTIDVPVQKPFFEQVGVATSPAQIQTLHMIRKITLANLSPMANFGLADRCCADVICVKDVANSRAANHMSPNKFSTGGQSVQ